MPFNDEQQAAISASANEDILISAGAGSGKTKTLSEEIEEYKEEVKAEAKKLTNISHKLYYFLNEP